LPGLRQGKATRPIYSEYVGL